VAFDPTPVLTQADALFNQGDYENARRLLEDLAAKRPDDPAVLRGLALVLIRLDEPKRAFANLQKALKVAPNDAEAHFSLATFYLSRGNYPQGFVEYEWRLSLPKCIAPRYAGEAAFWDGRSLEGESLMLHCEQGVGDAMQFIRFLPQVRERVRTIHLACHPGLVRLFSELEGLAGIVTEKQEVPRCDFHCPLLSLPRIFGTTLETLPRTVPYLPVPTVQQTVGTMPRVGLVWRAGAPNAGGSYRSATLRELLPWAEAPVEWVNLQKDANAEEKALLRSAFRVAGEGPALRDFQETAEVVQGLDLVISVDTSPLHVAGGLGKPIWIPVPRWADWRWLTGRADSPWYPTATLFRQERDRDWSGPVREIGLQLRKWLWELRKGGGHS